MAYPMLHQGLQSKGANNGFWHSGVPQLPHFRWWVTELVEPVLVL